MGGTLAASPDFSVAPIPAWVQPIAPTEPAVTPTEQISQGTYYLLVDTQTRVDAQDKTHYPSVEWGEFKDWQAVARWAAPYYRLPAQLSPALQVEVDRIAKAHASPEERLLAALQFVQREIRYMGVEIGPGSHAPSAPQKVLERRFGDCKDKSLLTMTLLQSLGIGTCCAGEHLQAARHP